MFTIYYCTQSYLNGFPATSYRQIYLHPTPPLPALVLITYTRPPSVKDASDFSPGSVTQVSALADRPTPRPHRGNVKTGHPNSLSCSGVRAQLKLQSPDGKYPQQIAQTPKATSYGPEPQIPDSCTRPHSATRQQPRTAAGWSCKGGMRKPVLFAAQEPPDDLSDLAEASESAPELRDNPIDDPGLERFVRSIRYIHSTSE